MLKRKVGEFVVVNPYYDTTGTIINTREVTSDSNFNKNFDYKVKWNQKMEKGCLEWKYWNENQLESLENDWNIVKPTLKSVKNISEMNVK